MFDEFHRCTSREFKDSVMRTSYNTKIKRGAHGMKRPCLVRFGLAAVALMAIPCVEAFSQDAETFSIAPLQNVTFGGGDGDTFSVEQISRTNNSVTVLLRPMGEGCVFRFPVTVGRSVQLRADTPGGESMMCKATLQPITEDGSAQFGAECNPAPISREHKCPSEGDTAAAADYPQN